MLCTRVPGAEVGNAMDSLLPAFESVPHRGPAAVVCVAFCLSHAWKQRVPGDPRVEGLMRLVSKAAGDAERGFTVLAAAVRMVRALAYVAPAAGAAQWGEGEGPSSVVVRDVLYAVCDVQVRVAIHEIVLRTGLGEDALNDQAMHVGYQLHALNPPGGLSDIIERVLRLAHGEEPIMQRCEAIDAATAVAAGCDPGAGPLFAQLVRDVQSLH
jgi:hypothetical protein